MGEWEYINIRLMELLAIIATRNMIDAFVRATIKEKEKLTRLLGHEPTEENWQYYYAFLREQGIRQDMRRKEADKEKIRHFVLGEGNMNDVSGRRVR